MANLFRILRTKLYQNRPSFVNDMINTFRLTSFLDMVFITINMVHCLWLCYSILHDIYQLLYKIFFSLLISLLHRQIYDFSLTARWSQVNQLITAGYYNITAQQSSYNQCTKYHNDEKNDLFIVMTVQTAPVVSLKQCRYNQ